MQQTTLLTSFSFILGLVCVSLLHVAAFHYRVFGHLFHIIHLK